jgi:hypothetical protein
MDRHPNDNVPGQINNFSASDRKGRSMAEVIFGDGGRLVYLSTQIEL